MLIKTRQIRNERRLHKALERIFANYYRHNTIVTRSSSEPPRFTKTNWVKKVDDAPPADIGPLWQGTPFTGESEPIKQIMAIILDLSRKIPLKENDDESDISDNVYMMF